MKANEIKKEIYDKLVSLDYHRKVNFVDEEVTSSVDFYSFDEETRQVINTFYVHGFKSGIDLMSIELDGEQQLHILIIGGKYYLVDTQGYNYPRYIIGLENFEFEIEDDYIERMDGLIRIADDQIFNAVVKSLVLELREEDFSQEDILNFLQFKLDMAIEATKK